MNGGVISEAAVREQHASNKQGISWVFDLTNNSCGCETEVSALKLTSKK